MKFRKYLMVGVVAAAVSATAACGSDSSNDLPVVTPKATTTTAAASASPGSFEEQLTDPNKRPSVEALNDMLQQALDPDIAPKDKTQLVEGSEVDPDLFKQLVKAKEENPDVTYKIKKPVVGNGPKRASVKVEVKIPDNPPTKLDASIVFDDGRWKLSKETVCPLLTAYEVETPLCADGSDSSTSAKKKPSTAKTTASRPAASKPAA